MTQVRDAALAWHDAGYCVLPTKTDGSKAPAVGSWTQYQTSRPSRDQVAAWFANGHPGVGLVCGSVSGNLEMLELEGRAVDEGALTDITRLLTDADLGDLWLRITANGYAERTPSGGLHFLYRVNGSPVPGNTKLANRPARDNELTDDERRILDRHPHRVITRGLAETRGEGGYVVVAPSNGTTHPTGQPWELTYGQYGQVPTITADEREQLHRAFRSLDTMPAPAAPAPTPARRLEVVRAAGAISPGDDFEARTGWDDPLLLGGAGWTVISGSPGSYCEWRRPGKTDPGMSATTGKDPGRDRLYVFSSSTEFDTETPYTKFGAYTLLHHGGNHTAAARELARLGYGTPLERTDPAAEQRAAIADLLPPGQAARVLAAVDGTAARVLADPDQGPKRSIKLASDADTIRQVQEAINTGALPDTYVTNGELVELTRISGDSSAAGLAPAEQPPLPIVSTSISPDGLAALLAHHTYTHRVKKTRDGDLYEEEFTPPARSLASVLSRRYWPGVPALHGIVGSPVLRPDGTLLQQPGYDPATGLYLAPTVTVPAIPDRPAATDVATARDFLLGDFLGDFPWVDPSDRANYIGLLVAQILRPYLRTVTPFGLISADNPSSGKTILSEGIGLLFGQRVRPWVRSENEQRKAITAVLDENAPTIVFDNIKEGEVINSPVLAMLITTPVWTDRILGTNKTFSAANDRLWLATGNNIRLGGDMASRTVLVRLNAKTPHPELRDPEKFAIPNLDLWVKNPANRTVLLRHLLILVMDWIANGATRTGHTMRQFSTWAAAAGGFLQHHRIGGFLDNATAVRELDEQASEWINFLSRWHELYGSDRKLAREIRQSADIEYEAGRTIDRWQGDFITDDESNLPKNAIALSAKLRGHVGRFYGDFVLRSKRDTDKNVTWWWVEQGGEEA